MEFRIFLPRLSEEDYERTEIRPLVLKYGDIISSVIAAFGGLNAPFPDKREDVYLIGGAHFGIKFRAGKKLELKMRRQKLDFSIEHWKKVKFGKKKISHYKNDILDLIEKECDQQMAEDVKMIEDEKFIGISKARRIQISGEISNEICLISTDSNARKWISIAIEGSLIEIQNYLHSKSYELNLILEALYHALEIVKIDIDMAIINSRVFIPVLGGYPTWVRVVANSEISSRNEINEIINSIEKLLISLSFTSTFDVNDETNIENDKDKNDYTVIPSRVLREEKKRKENCCFELC
mmetsp:Transcript_20296/g.19604  ORF Transcript_20296/g.19604 Transcript_20296/m.19604 type:complete len:295 (+) Transcript_20296:233-1117(+)|eukprot:CAMPEP_0119046434 /NCGR_PEP_ID=MMETSP1177-20130426/46582_1 /TAXON_ID=2985 /ORGANISM="Ochromonas sp, Strain CCMP1899" /LENGTH=294 /DNA_ID=CAMNT_0007019583 /DNA_START=187 /DNA_END=1071 /DNA_ORIENTATION=-